MKKKKKQNTEKGSKVYSSKKSLGLYWMNQKKLQINLAKFKTI